MKRYEQKEDNKLLNIGMCMLVFAALCLAACTDNADDNDSRRGDKLRLLSYSAPFQDVPASRAVTVPTNFLPFATMYPDATTSLPGIGVYLTPHEASRLQTFNYRSDGSWETEIRVKEDDYYIYGFLPLSAASSSSIAPNGTSYADGAILSLTDLPSMSYVDPCVTVGIKSATSPDASVSVGMGNYQYVTQEKGHNYIYMLFDHLYAALNFSIRVDATYAALRTIYIKSMWLKTTAQSVADVQVVMVPGLDPISGATYTLKSTAGMEFPVITTTGTGTALTTVYQSIGQMVCFAPSIGTTLSLVTEYDIYDRKGNLVRAGCRAENALGLPNFLRGQRKTVRLTVNPTYLYQLSEPELDNPTISID